MSDPAFKSRLSAFTRKRKSIAKQHNSGFPTFRTCVAPHQVGLVLFLFLLLLVISWAITVLRLGDVQSRAVHQLTSDIQKSRSEPLFSNVSILASTSGSGLMNKYYYEFRNVYVDHNGRIKVYYDPNNFGFNVTDKGYSYWVDVLSGNASSPLLPTTLVLKGEVHNSQWYYLHIDYIPMSGDRSSPPASFPCSLSYTGSPKPGGTAWIHNPAILLQARYSYNIWHSFNEGIMSVFQTLRELGHLPLVRVVGDDGTLMPIDESIDEHRYEYDLHTDRVVRVAHPTASRYRGLSSQFEKCDRFQQQAWCRDGAVISAHRYGIKGMYKGDKLAPIILAYTQSSLENAWSHLYGAMTDHVDTWESTTHGRCLSSLIVGHTSTLNFYQSINDGKNFSKSVLQKYPRINNRAARERAIAVFQEFVQTAEQQSSNFTFSGYPHPGRELLRRGIGPKHLSQRRVIDAVYATEVPGTVRFELGELKAEAEKTVSGLSDLSEIKVTGDRYPAYNQATLQREYDDYESIAAHHCSVESWKQRTTDTRSTQKYGCGLDDDDSGQDNGLSAVSQLSATHQADQENRPVVTYMSRNFFSRGVLNEGDIIEYILTRYNVTLRVTTLEEPLLEVINLLASSDVVLGMHGAGWTNALFIKRGAVTLQLFPHGWQSSKDSFTFRGYNYKEIVLASRCLYYEWVNPVPDNAFFRRFDYTKADGQTTTFSLHPPKPYASSSVNSSNLRNSSKNEKHNGLDNPWVYQNTYIDIALLGPVLDEVMTKANASRL